MLSNLKHLSRIFIILLLSVANYQTVLANVNAIDFHKVPYPESLQSKIDFLRTNHRLYNHWAHTWNADISKENAVNNLTLLYNEIVKLPANNAETELLLGDISHYLYNMEVDAYYQKAMDHYTKAIALAPEDYRTYWFMGNHYSLSAKPDLAISTYKKALQYLPSPKPDWLFWADYAIAFANAGMQMNARYAAHQASVTAGEATDVEDQIKQVTTKAFHSPPLDTVVAAKDMWQVSAKTDKKVEFTNLLLGMRMSVDGTWNLNLNEFHSKQAYLTLAPDKIVGKKGKAISYSMMIFVRSPKEGETLQQYADLFTGKNPSRKAVKFDVGPINNTIAYELIDPSMYPDLGGGHGYAIVFERSRPEYPGIEFEKPVSMQSEKDGQVQYYASNQNFGRLSGKLYYLVLLDSCEDIHEGSLAVFKEFVNNLSIE